MKLFGQMNDMISSSTERLKRRVSFHERLCENVYAVAMLRNVFINGTEAAK